MLSDPKVITAIIGIIPSIVTVLALTTVLVVFRHDIRRMVHRISGFEAFGLKVSLFDVKGWTLDANKARNLGVTDTDLRKALDRGAAAAEAYQGVKILWVDDHPEKNDWERRALTALGSDISVVLSNAEAYDRLRRTEFDVLISDLARDSGEDAREVPKSLQGNKYRPTVLYYIFTKDDRPVPEEAFGITTRPDELVDLVTDVLERRLHSQSVTRSSV